MAQLRRKLEADPTRAQYFRIEPGMGYLAGCSAVRLGQVAAAVSGHAIPHELLEREGGPAGAPSR
jgi:hypothetical protein